MAYERARRDGSLPPNKSKFMNETDKTRFAKRVRHHSENTLGCTEELEIGWHYLGAHLP